MQEADILDIWRVSHTLGCRKGGFPCRHDFKRAVFDLVGFVSRNGWVLGYHLKYFDDIDVVLEVVIPRPLDIQPFFLLRLF